MICHICHAQMAYSQDNGKIICPQGCVSIEEVWVNGEFIAPPLAEKMFISSNLEPYPEIKKEWKSSLA